MRAPTFWPAPTALSAGNQGGERTKLKSGDCQSVKRRFCAVQKFAIDVFCALHIFASRSQQFPIPYEGPVLKGLEEFKKVGKDGFDA